MVTNYEINTDKNDSILIADQTAVRIGVLVDNTNVTANENGKKIIKAGTPVGNTTKSALIDRTTVLTTSVTSGSDTQTVTPAPQGIIYRDVDVTDGNAEAVLIVAGAIDVLKVDETTRAKITKPVINALNKITFISGRED